MRRVSTSTELRYLGSAVDDRGLIVPDGLPVARMTPNHIQRVRAELVGGWPVGTAVLRHLVRR